jgi:hypothetical protein
MRIQPRGTGGLRSLASALFAITTSLAWAAPPACKLLPDGLPGYFGIEDMPRLTESEVLCVYWSGVPGQAFVASLSLGGFRTPHEAREALKTACSATPEKIHLRKLRLPRARGACAYEREFDSGNGKLREAVAFIFRGRTMAELILGAPAQTDLARVDHVAAAARGVLKRWH